ncbi:MAG: hypothetical protein H0W34_11930 [Pyrinomonadaceae bacterium]|nr:hypothetical protein [Pyrinomonadaceae bacterium]
MNGNCEQNSNLSDGAGVAAHEALSQSLATPSSSDSTFDGTLIGDMSLDISRSEDLLAERLTPIRAGKRTIDDVLFFYCQQLGLLMKP